MNSTTRKSLRRRTRGQVLVLACVTFLTMALMMMASFAVANAVHERIRIQAAADAQAYSIATMEARAFNTMAYTNRAIAGALVSEMALHAWKSIAIRDYKMMFAGFISFLQVAALEFAQCPKFNLQHCWHGIEALKIAFDYKSKSSELENEVQSKESDFKDAVTKLNDAIKDTHTAQKDMLDKVKGQIDNGSILKKLLKETAPQASFASLGDYNTSDFACALEGSSFDGDCQSRSWKSAGSVLSADKRRDVMESAAMAARAPFEAGSRFGRTVAGSDYRNQPLPLPVIRNPQAAMDIQDEGQFIETAIGMTKGEVANDNVSGDVDMAIVFVQWKHGVGGFVETDTKAESGNPYRGVPCNGDDCFINFRQNPSGGETDYGQPATYGAVKQDLRKTREEKTGSGWVSARPWEVNKDGNVSVQLTSDKPAELKLVGKKTEGFAIAKGKTYFHQMGAWDVPPNMFDPFWHAKLQPFVRDELSEVLGEIGDSDGQTIIDNSNSAVEGVIK